MSKNIFSILALATLLLSVTLASCAPTPAPTEPAAPTEAPPEPTEAPPEPTEAPPEPTEVPPEPTEVPPEPTEAPPPGPDPSGQTVIFWHPWGPGIPGNPYETMVGIIDEFSATNEWGITVEEFDQGNYGDLEDAMNVSIQSGDLPNLVAGYYPSLANWFQVDVLVDFNEYVDDPTYGLTAEEKADFYPGVLDGPVTPDGARVGFPLSQSGNVMFYNHTWAQELGFDDPPTNSAEFKEQVCAAAEANSADDNPDNDGTGGLVLYPAAENILPWIWAFGGDIEGEGGQGYAFNTPVVQEVAAFIKELWDEGCAFETESYPNPEFATRKALVVTSSTVGLPYQLSAFETDDAFSEDEWGYIPFPGKEGGLAVDAYGQAMGLVNNTPEQNLAGWLFMKYLSSPDVQVKWINSSAYYPTRASVVPMLADYAAEHPKWGTGLQLLEYGHAEPTLPSFATIRREIRNTFSAILQSDLDQVESLLAELDAIAAEAVAELDQ